MQDQRLNIDLNSAQDITCDNCGNYTFQEVALMKRLSALVSPTGKDAMIPIPTFACAACGFVNKQFLPTQIASEPTPETSPASPITLVK